ncbi:MAG TPA: Ice-structuring protein [Candidatus Gemmiger faecigallinarum]|nr:Ice-structuring protein [Candidatus Gemmiger faecigallinarum]
MASSREEQLRNNRRLARQFVGLVAIVLIIIGLFTVVSWCVSAIRAALDDTDRRQSYADRLYGLVMFDPLPFDDVSQVDQSVFKQAAIWGCVYQIQASGGSLDDYERDEETGSVMLPQLEVDTYLTNLLGPDYQVEEGSFETTEMNYIYDEERQAYLVPVTGAVGLYTPEVESIETHNGQLHVTVGYIPTLASTTSLTLTTPTEPTKYMDYIFSRGENRQWYLSALQESEMQPQATATPGASGAAAPTPDPQALVESNLGTASSSTEQPTDATPVPEKGADDSQSGDAAGEASSDSQPQQDASSEGGDAGSSDGGAAE